MSSLPFEQLPAEYKKCFLYRWYSAIKEVTSHLRENVLLPLDPRSKDGVSVFSNVASGIALPVWHCPFQTCGVEGKTMPYRATAVASCKEVQQRSTYEKELWAHVSMRHGFVLRSIAKKLSLIETSMKEAEVLLTLYNSALAEKERSSVPILGHSTDRRTIEHVGQVFKMTMSMFSCVLCVRAKK